MMKLISTILKRFAGEQGQALGEFGLLVALVAIVCVAALTALGLAIAGPFGDVTGGF